MVFFSSGNRTACADTILVNHNILGQNSCLVIDTGSRVALQTLLRYLADNNIEVIDDIIITHSDSDHSSQVCNLLNTCKVNHIWMHTPWEHVDVKTESLNFELDLFKRYTHNELCQKLKKIYRHIEKIHNIAAERQIPVLQPYSGQHINGFLVLSPSENFFKQLIIESDKFADAYKSVEGEIDEFWENELLAEKCDTSSENEASVILYTECAKKGILLTGDAGVRALQHAVDHVNEHSLINLKELSFFQVPHHGSRSNVNPHILDQILGNKIAKNEYNPTKIAAISATDVRREHPSGMVVNAVIRRNWKVFITAEENIHFEINSAGVACRTTSKPVSFRHQVKGYRR
jgi:beta-lactamase superfamily II metal-dependent hydrolase